MHLQIDDVFAKGDLGEMVKAVEAMEAAGLEASNARFKLTRILTALNRVIHKNIAVEGREN